MALFCHHGPLSCVQPHGGWDPERRRRAVPDNRLRDLFRDRVPRELASPPVRHAVEAVHPRGELRLLQLVGLAIRLLAGGVDAVHGDRRVPRRPLGDRAGPARLARRDPRRRARTARLVQVLRVLLGQRRQRAPQARDSARHVPSCSRSRSPSGSRSSPSWRCQLRDRHLPPQARAGPLPSTSPCTSPSSRTSSPDRSCAARSCCPRSDGRATRPRPASTTPEAAYADPRRACSRRSSSRATCPRRSSRRSSPTRRSALGASRSSSPTWGYAVQIYCDFSRLHRHRHRPAPCSSASASRQNFDAPYTATSLQDFWRRWHMTLSLAARLPVHPARRQPGLALRDCTATS